MVLDKDLEKEIKRAESRLYYLRNRKQTGIPGGVSKKVKSPYVRGNNEDNDELYIFYRNHILDGSFEKEYEKMKDEMIKKVRDFATFHNTIYRAINKYGNDKYKEVLKKLSGNEDFFAVDDAEVKVNK